MPNIDWNNIETQTKSLAQTLLGGYINETLSDVRDFKGQAAGQIETWTQETADGKMTQKNLASLIRGEADLAEMTALERAGIAQITLDTFTNGFLQIVINAALAAI